MKPSILLIKRKDIVAFTDGSCMSKGKQKICGYGIIFPEENIKISKPFTLSPLTNQRTELFAIKVALDYTINNFDFETLTIYSDSEYSIKSLTIWIKNWKKNNWKTTNGKAVLNQDIIKSIDDILQNYPKKIYMKHIRSHTGKTDYWSKYNDVADGLAKQGALNS
jgi:ribonuclease HI